MPGMLETDTQSCSCHQIEEGEKVSENFVRILVPDPSVPGGRIRLEWDRDVGYMILSEEEVFPERVYRSDAHHVRTLDSIDLTPALVDWLCEAFIELRDEIRKVTHD